MAAPHIKGGCGSKPLVGALVKEYLPSTQYGTLAAPEPSNPNFVWVYINGPTSGLVRYNVNPSAGTWSVDSVYIDVFENHALSNIAPHFTNVIERAGETYIIAGSNRTLSIMHFDPATRVLRPSPSFAPRHPAQTTASPRSADSPSASAAKC